MMNIRKLKRNLLFRSITVSNKCEKSMNKYKNYVKTMKISMKY